jgi:hypothetical protein
MAGHARCRLLSRRMADAFNLPEAPGSRLLGVGSLLAADSEASNLVEPGRPPE